MGVARPRLLPSPAGDCAARRRDASDYGSGTMSLERGSRQNPAVAGVACLLLRSLLLWVVVPPALLAWLVSSGWLGRRGVTAGKFLGWVDLNLTVFLSRIILRPLFPDPPLWVPVSQISDVTHRLSWFDFG